MFNFKTEKAEGDAPADMWASAIIKVACILVIGVVILNGIVGAVNTSALTGTYATLFNTVSSNISSGYTLAALMVLAIGAGAIMHFLGFM